MWSICCFFVSVITFVIGYELGRRRGDSAVLDYGYSLGYSTDMSDVIIPNATFIADGKEYKVTEETH